MAATVSVKAPINGEVLRWARESIGVAPEKAAKRANVAIDIYKKWESGLCIPSEAIDKGQQVVEKFCNEFAGNFLVPTPHLKESIKESQFSKIEELIPDLSKKFIVSQFVILRRLYSEKEVDYKEYQRLFKELQKGVKKVESAGGNFYKNQYAEKGKRFISLVVEAESSRKITLSRALDYLGIKTGHYDRIVDMLYE